MPSTYDLVCIGTTPPAIKAGLLINLSFSSKYVNVFEIPSVASKSLTISFLGYFSFLESNAAPKGVMPYSFDMFSLIPGVASIALITLILPEYIADTSGYRVGPPSVTSV